MPTELSFDRYYPYAPLTEILQDLVVRYPTLLQIESIGTSHEGRDVWCVTATNQATGPAREKPAFWCDANIHATEVSPSSALLYLIHKVANSASCGVCCLSDAGADEQTNRTRKPPTLVDFNHWSDGLS